MSGAFGKYREEYCQRIIEYFDRDPFAVVVDENGKPTKIPIYRFPTLEGFAHSLGVTRATLYNWGKRHAQFLYALKRARDLQADFLINAALYRVTNPVFSIFTAKNILGWSDKGRDSGVEVDLSDCLTLTDKAKKVFNLSVSGVISLEQGTQLMKLLMFQVDIAESDELAKRVQEMENIVNGNK